MSIRHLLLASTFLFLAACQSNAPAPVVNDFNKVQTTQRYHIVQAGETIYSIAWRYGKDYHQLADYNHLSAPYNLKVGQKLRLTPPPAQVQTTTTQNTAIESAPTFQPVSTTPAINKTTATSSNKAPAATNAATSSSAEPNSLQALNGDNAPAKTSASPSNDGWQWPVRGKVVNGYSDSNKGLDIAVPPGTPVKATSSGTVVYAGSNLHGYGQLIIVKHNDDVMTAYAHNSKLLVHEGSKVNAGQTIALSGDSEASSPMLHFEVRRAGKPVNPMDYLH